MINSRKEDALFYDTTAIIKDIDNLIEKQQSFIVSTISLYKLENIPKYKEVWQKMLNNKNLWLDWYYPSNHIEPQLKEIFAALNYEEIVRPDETIFVTGSYTSSLIANRYFGEDSIQYLN